MGLIEQLLNLIIFSFGYSFCLQKLQKQLQINALTSKALVTVSLSV